MEPKSVAPKDVESELTKIWDQLEGQGKMRACLYNLIVYTHCSSRLPYLREIIQKTIDKFPSRIIFITSCEGESIKAKVSVLSSGTIACDLIEVNMGAGMEDKITFLLLPYLIPDLPVYVLWTEDILEGDKTLSQIKDWVTRIIFDSESTDNLSRFAESVLKYTECNIADLNWGRIEGWRVLISNLFKSQSKLEELKDTKKMHITYNCHATPYFCHTRIQALYFQAWIATALGWKFVSTQTTERLFTIQYENAEITLEPVNFEQIAPGRVVTIEIQANSGNHTLLQRSPETPHQIIIQHSTPDFCSLPTYFMFAKYESGQSLVNEICHLGTHTHYLNVLKQLSQINHTGLPT